MPSLIRLLSTRSGMASFAPNPHNKREIVWVCVLERERDRELSQDRALHPRGVQP
jgi:hypothetical protein